MEPSGENAGLKNLPGALLKGSFTAGPQSSSIDFRVVAGKAQTIDENTMVGQGTHAFYLPSADGDELPDESQEPIVCLPYTITSKRVQLMPPCVTLPPPPEPDGE